MITAESLRHSLFLMRDYKDFEIVLEVGGDGAIHTGSAKSVRVEDGRIVVSAEQ